MKKNALLLILLIAFVSCKKETTEAFGKNDSEIVETVKPNDLGEQIFNGKGMCYSCHKPNQKVIGPSVAEIAKIYKEKGASITDFLTEKSKPIVDPSQYSVMKTNFAITKNLPKEELAALESYMLSFAK
ncbi:cytochrome c551/c552 family protein [Flavobacterium saliperosum S13]|uniref:Cytochrome c n=2 Tax=Flavobacterium saliperosum TaxID=329186 RepID=A0A1G4W7D4_9FLAO|nr:c-type cytochrome [Flavobacterium saliperosum]ESU22956.1 cytochrome c551/c552 family protein [Flavobacterium saliperosum S13]SCX17948.1 cytochrome c [Flavobacterium saliperosum]